MKSPFSLSIASPAPSANAIETNASQASAQTSALGTWWRARESLVTTALAAFLALAFCAYYLSHTFVMNEADPRLLAQFNGNRPYQLRVLIPFLVHWGARLTALDIARCYQLILMAVSLAFFPVFSAYLRQFCAPRAARWLSLSLAWPLFAFYSHKWFYLYDLPAAFFATLGLLLMAQRNWPLYFLVFTLATLNRESSAFTVLAFVFALHDALPRRQFLLLLAGQIGIWIALRAVLAWVFASNAGGSLEWHLAYNLNCIARFFTASTSFALGAAIATLLVLWATGAVTRCAQPQFLSRTRHVFWPFLVLMSGVGVLTETRLYAELIPILLAPALIGVFNLISPPSA